MMAIKLLLLFALLYMVNAQNRMKRAEEKSIWNELHRSDGSYDKHQAPKPFTNSPVQVGCTMYVIDISEVNEYEAEFTAQFYFRQYWNDPRLHYDEKNVTIRFLNPEDLEKLWIPDLFFVQEKEGKMHTVTRPNSFTRVSPSGKIFNSVRYSVTFSCNMDLRNFPHDSQSCEFSIESYAYRASEIKLSWDGSAYQPVSITDTPSLMHYTIEGLTYAESLVNVSTGQYSRLLLEIKIQRKSGYYLRNLYIPYIFLVIIAWLSFWIRLKYTALRLSLLLVVLGIMFYLSFAVNQYIPSVSYAKAIDVWTAFCIALVFAAFLEFVFISQYVKLERKKDKQRSEAETNLVDTESQKKEDTMPDKFLKFSKLVLPRMHKEDTGPMTVDLFFRYLFPIIFSLFNLIYWCFYAS